MKHINFDVPGLHPGEPNTHFDLVVECDDWFVMQLVAVLALFEYPKGDGTFVKVLNLKVTE